MKKLRLNLDAIRVEQFEVSAGDGKDGTVLGFVSYSFMCAGGGTCPPGETCNTNADQRCRC